jgi:predicted ABC-type ATPase
MTPIYNKPVLTIFAGPNGSGKSTIIKELLKSGTLGHYLNADDMEQILKERKHINLGDYFLTADEQMWQRFLADSSLHKKSVSEGYPLQLSIRDNVAVAASAVSSYEAALLVDFIRNLLIERKATLSFETVMSHPSKKDILRFALDNGYACNLHFVTTVSPIINIARVKDRVQKGGHDVPEDRIRSRYLKSLELLSEIIPVTKRTVLYDNSGKVYRIIATIYDGKLITLHDALPLPKWYQQYVADKLDLQPK